jgi:serine/threonine protein kinase
MSEITCQGCGSNATTYCPECEAKWVLCSKCWGHIHSLEKLRGHRKSSAFELRDVGVLAVEKDRIRKETLLGQGMYGEVWSGRYNSQDVAIKIPKAGEQYCQNPTLASRWIALFYREVALMRAVRNPFAVKIVGVCYDPEVLSRGGVKRPARLWILLERCATDLDKLLLRRVGQPQPEGADLPLWRRLVIAWQAAMGVALLHAVRDELGRPRPILHRDLKLANFLMGADGRVKVTDFGLSQLHHSDVAIDDGSQPRGSFIYMAPEVFARAPRFARVYYGSDFPKLATVRFPITTKSDVYTFALCLWEILSCTEVYPDVPSPEHMIAHVFTGSKRPPVDSAWPRPIAYIMHRCFATVPDDRPSMPQVVAAILEAIYDQLFHSSHARLFWSSLTSNGSAASSSSSSSSRDDSLLNSKRLCVDVEWRRFADAFFARFLDEPIDFEHSIDDAQCDSSAQQFYASLRRMFDCGPQGGQVSIDRVDPLFRLFAPSPPLSAGDSNACVGTRFKEQLLSVCSLPYFFHPLSEQDASTLLSNTEPGTFLLRTSSSESAALTLSSLSASSARVTHCKIRVDNGLWRLVGGASSRAMSAPSIRELIDAGARDLSLINPLGGGSFTPIFNPSTSSIRENLGYN